MAILPSVAQYTKNLARSTLFASAEVTGKLMPGFENFKTSNKEVFKEIFVGIKDYRRTITRLQAAIVQSKIFQAGEAGLRNLKEDLKTGNWYNENRQSRYEEKAIADSMGSSEFSFGDMGGDSGTGMDALGDFDVDKMLGDSEFDVSEEDTLNVTDGEALIAQAVKDGAKDTSTVISATNVEIAQNAQKTQRVATSLLYAQNEKMMKIQQEGFTAMNETIGNILKFDTEALKTHLDNSKTFFEQASKRDDERNAVLKEMLEMQRNWYKAMQLAPQEQKEKKKKLTWEDISLNEGFPSLENYFEAVQENFKNTANDKLGGAFSMLDSMGGMMGDNPLMAMVQNPLGSLMTSLVTVALGPRVQRAAENLDKTASGIFGTLISKFNRMAQEEDGISQMIGSILGIRNTLKTTIDTTPKRGVTQWNLDDHKALTEVIPHYLANIDANLSGRPHQLYNYETGKYENTADLQSKWNDMLERNRMKPFRDINQMMMKHFNSMMDRDYDQKVQLTKDWQSLMRYWFNNAGALQESTKVDLRDEEQTSDMAFNAGIDEENFKTIIGHLQKWVEGDYGDKSKTPITHRGDLMLLNREIMDARGQHNKEVQSMQDRGTIYENLFNNSYKQLRNIYTGELSKDNLGVQNQLLLINQYDNKHNNIFYYLQNIFATLLSIKIDGVGNGDGQKLIEILRASDTKAKQRRQISQGVPNIYADPIKAANDAMNKFTPAIQDRSGDYQNLTLQQQYNQRLQKQREQYEERVKKEAERKAKLGNKYTGPEFMFGINQDGTEINPYDEQQLRQARAEASFKSIQKEAESQRREDQEDRGVIGEVIDYFKRDKSEEEYKKDMEKINKDGFLESLIKAEDLGEKWNIIRLSLEHLADQPANMLATVMEQADEKLYRFFFKEEPITVNGVTYTGFFGRMRGEMEVLFKDINEGLNKHLLEPLKEKLGVEGPLDAVKKGLLAVGIDTEAIWKNMTEGFSETFEGVTDNIKETFTEFFQDAIDEIKTDEMKAREAEEEAQRKAQEEAGGSNASSSSTSGRTTNTGRPLPGRVVDMTEEEKDLAKSINDKIVVSLADKFEDLEILSTRDLKDVIDQLKTLTNTQAIVSKENETALKEILAHTGGILREGYGANIDRSAVLDEKTKLQEQIQSLQEEIDKQVEDLNSPDLSVSDQNKISGNVSLINRQIRQKQKNLQSLEARLQGIEVNPLTSEDVESLNQLQQSIITRDQEIEDKTKQDALDKEIEKRYTDVRSKQLGFNYNLRSSEKKEAHAFENKFEEAIRKASSNDIFSGMDSNLKEQMQIAFDTNRGFVFDLKMPQIDNFLLKGLGITDDTVRKELISSLKSKFEEEGSLDNILDLKTIRNVITKYVGDELETLEQAGIQSQGDQYNKLTDQLQDSLSRLLTRTGKISDFKTDEVLENEFLPQPDDLGILDILESGQKSSYDISSKILESIEKLGESFTTPTAITEALTDVQTKISESISTGIDTLSGKFDELISAISTSSISTHAEGTRMVTKAGITAISDGEMIVPANLNPFNPDREKVNIKSQLANEQRIRQEYATDVAKNMINQGIPDKYKAGISTIPTNAQGWLNVDFSKPKDQQDYVNRLAEEIAGKIPTHAVGEKKVNVATMDAETLKSFASTATKLINFVKSLKDSYDVNKMSEGDLGKAKEFLVSELGIDKEEVEKLDKGKIMDKIRDKLFELRKSGIVTEDKTFTADDEQTYTLDNIKDIVTQFSRLREANRKEEIEEFLKNNPTAKALADSVNSIKEGVQEAFTKSLGIDSTQVKKAVKEASDTVKKSTPDMIAKGLLGGVLGLAVGGPLVGAMLGAGVGLVQNNEYFMEQLFGKKSLVNPKTGKPMREGGIIDRDTMDTFQHYFKPMLAHGTAGGVLGLITPFGPFGGAMIGASVGFLRKNKDFMDTFFGEEDGIIDKKAQEFIKKSYPNMAVTALGTMFLGPFGLLGNAALGAGLGLLGSTNMFKDYIFGVEDPFTHKREGGFVGAIREGLVEPWVEFGKTFVKESMDWIRNDLFKPVKDAFIPITKQIQLGVSGLLKGAGMILRHQLEIITGRPFANKLQEYLFEPFSKIGQTLINAVATPVKAAISLPFKAVGGIGDLLRRRHVQRGTASYMTAAERIGFRKDHGMDEESEQNKLDTNLARTKKTDLKKLHTLLQYIQDGGNELERQRGRKQKQVWETINRTLGKGNFSIFKGYERDQINELLLEGKEQEAMKLIQEKTAGLTEDKRQDIMNQIIGAHTEAKQAKMLVDNFGGDKNKVREELQDKLGIQISEGNTGDIMALISKEIKARDEEKEKIEKSKDKDTGNVTEVEGKLLEATQVQTDTLGAKLDEMIKILRVSMDPDKAHISTSQTMQLASTRAMGDFFNEESKLEHERNSVLISQQLKSKFGDDFKASKESLSALDSKEGDRRLNKLLKVSEGFRIDPEKLDTYMQMSNESFDRMIKLFDKTGLQMMDTNLSKLDNISDEQLENVINAHKLGLKFDSIDEYKDVEFDDLKKMKQIRDITGLTNRTLDTDTMKRMIDSGFWSLMTQRPEDYMNIQEKDLKQLKGQKQDVQKTGIGDRESISPEINNRNIWNTFANFMARTGISLPKPLIDGLINKLSGKKFFDEGSKEYNQLKDIEERTGIPIEDILTALAKGDTKLVAASNLYDLTKSQLGYSATGGQFVKKEDKQSKGLTAISEGELITKAQPIPVSLGKGTIDKLADNVAKNISVNALGSDLSKHMADTTEVVGDLSRTPVPVELGDDSIKTISDNISKDISTHASGGMIQAIRTKKNELQSEAQSSTEDLSDIVERRQSQERTDKEREARRLLVTRLLAQGRSYADAVQEAQNTDVSSVFDSIKDTGAEVGYNLLIMLDNLQKAARHQQTPSGQQASFLKTLAHGGEDLASTSDSWLRMGIGERFDNIIEAARNTRFDNFENATGLIRSLLSLGTKKKGWRSKGVLAVEQAGEYAGDEASDIAKDRGSEVVQTKISELLDALTEAASNKASDLSDKAYQTLTDAYTSASGVAGDLYTQATQNLSDKVLQALQNLDPEIARLIVTQGDTISTSAVDILKALGMSARGGSFTKREDEQSKGLTAISEGELITKAQPIPVSLGKGTIDKLADNVIKDIPANALGSDLSKHMADTTEVVGDLSRTPVPIELGDDSIKTISDSISKDISTHASGGMISSIIDTKNQIQQEVANSGEDLSKVVDKKFTSERQQKEREARRLLVTRLLAQGKSYADAVQEAQNTNVTGLKDKLGDSVKKTGYEEIVMLDNLRKAFKGGIRDDGQQISLLKTLLRGSSELASTSDSMLKVTLSERAHNIREAARNTGISSLKKVTGLLRSLISLGEEKSGWTKEDVKKGIIALPVSAVGSKVKDEIESSAIDNLPSETLSELYKSYNEIPDRILQTLVQNLDSETLNTLLTQGDQITAYITKALGLSAKGGVRQQKKKAKQEEFTQPTKKSHKEIQEEVKRRKQAKKDEEEADKEAAAWATPSELSSSVQIPAGVNTNPTVDSPVPVVFSGDTQRELSNAIINSIYNSGFQGIEQESFINTIYKQVSKSKNAQGVKKKDLEQEIKKHIILSMTKDSDSHLWDSAHTWDDKTTDELYKMAIGEENRKLMNLQIGKVTNIRDQREKLDKMTMGQLREITSTAKTLERDQAIEKAVANGVDRNSLKDKPTEEIVKLAEQSYYSPTNAIGRVVKSAKDFFSSSESPLDKGQSIVDSVMDKVDSAKEWVKEKKDDAVEWGTKIGRRILVKINDIVDDIGQGISTKMSQFKDYVSENVSQGIKWFTDKYDKFMADPKTQAMLTQFTEFFDSVKDTASAIFSYGKERAGLFIEVLGDTIKEKAKLYYESSTKWLKETMKPYYDELQGYLKEAWAGITGFMKDTIWGGLKSGVSKAVDWALGDGSSEFKEKWTKRFTNASESLQDFSSSIKERTAKTRVKRLARQEEYKGLDEDRLRFIDQVKQNKMEDVFIKNNLDIKTMDLKEGNEFLDQEIKDARDRRIDKESSLSIIEESAKPKKFSNYIDEQIHKTDVQNQLDQYKQLFIRKGLPEKEADKLVKSIQPSESVYLNKALNIVFGEEFAADKKETRLTLQDINKVQPVSKEAARQLVKNFMKAIKELKEQTKAGKTSNFQATLEAAKKLSPEEQTKEELNQRLDQEADAWANFGKPQTTELPGQVKATTEEAESVAPKKEETKTEVPEPNKQTTKEEKKPEVKETHATGGVATDSHIAVVSAGESIGKVEPIPVKLDFSEADRLIKEREESRIRQRSMVETLVFQEAIVKGKKPRDMDPEVYKDLRKRYREMTKEENIKKYGHIGALLKDVSEFLEKVGDTATAVYRYGKERAKIFFKALGQTVKDKVVEKATAAKDWLKKKLNPLKEELKKKYKEKKEAAKKKLTEAKDWVNEKLGFDLTGKVGKVTGWIGDKFSGATDTLENIRSGVQAEYDKIQEEKKASGNNYDTLVEVQKLAIDENAKALEQNAKQVVSGLHEELKPVIAVLKEMLPKEVRDKLETIGEVKEETAKDIEETVQESVQEETTPKVESKESITETKPKSKEEPKTETKVESKETSIPEPSQKTSIKQQLNEKAKSILETVKDIVPKKVKLHATGGVATDSHIAVVSAGESIGKVEPIPVKLDGLRPKNSGEETTIPTPYGIAKAKESRDGSLIPANRDAEEMMDKVEEDHTANLETRDAVQEILEFLKGEDDGKDKEKKEDEETIFDKLLKGFKWLKAALVGAIGALLKWLKDFKLHKWEDIKAKADEVWNKLKQRAEEFWTGLKRRAGEFYEGIARRFGSLWERIKQGPEELLRRIREVPTKIGDMIGRVSESAQRRYTQMIESVENRFSGMVDTITTRFANMIDSIGTRFGNIVDSISGKLGAVGTTVTERGGQIIDTVTARGQELASRAGGVLRNVFGHNTEILGEVREEMALADAKNAAKESLKTLSPEELTRLQQVYNAPGIQAIVESGHIPPGMNPETFTRLQAIGEMGPEGVSRLIEGLPAETSARAAGAISLYRSVGGISGAAKGVGKFILDTAIHAPGDALKGISNITELAKGGITGNLEKATKGIMNVAAPAEVGKASSIINHIIGPILTGLGKVAELVGKVIGQVPGAKPQEIGKAFQKFGTVLAEKVAQKAGARMMGQALLRFIPFAGQAYMAYAGIKAFYDGINNPGLMLHIADPEKITFSQRVLAGIVNAVVDLCTFGILTADDVLPLVMEHIAPFLGVAEESTKDMQDSEKEYEQYKTKTGKSDLSFKDFLKETGRYKELDMLDNLKDIGSTLATTITDKVGGMFDSIKETGENLSEWITSSSEDMGKSLVDFATNVKDNVLKGVEDTATIIKERATAIGVGVIEGKPLKIINEVIKPGMSYLTEKNISFGKALPGIATIPFATIGIGIASITSVLGSVKDFLGKTFDGLSNVNLDLSFYWDYKGNPFDKKYLDHVGTQYDKNNPITAIPSIMESIAKYFLLPFKAIGMVIDWVKEKAGGILKKVTELKNMLPFIGDKTDNKSSADKGTPTSTTNNSTTTAMTTVKGMLIPNFTIIKPTQKPIMSKDEVTKSFETISKQDQALGTKLKQGFSSLISAKDDNRPAVYKSVSNLLDQQPAKAEVERVMKEKNSKLPKDKQLDYEKTKKLIIQGITGVDESKFGKATKHKKLDTYGKALSNAVNYSQVSSDVKDLPMNIAGDTQKETIGTRGCSVTIGSAISKFGVLPDKKELIKDVKPYLAKDDGTNFSYFGKEANKYGMESKQTHDTSTIMDHLKKGGSTVLMGTGNDLFGEGHHYVSATGLGKNKQGEDLVEINDPERLGSKVYKKKDVLPFVETGFNIKPKKGKGPRRAYALKRYGRAVRVIENDPRYHGPEYNMMHSDDSLDVKEAKLKTQMQWIEDNPKEAKLPDSKDYRPGMQDLSEKVPQRFRINPQKDNVVDQRWKMKKQREYLGDKMPEFSMQDHTKTTFGKAFQRFGKDNEKKDETKTDTSITNTSTTNTGNKLVMSDNMTEEQIWDWFRWRGYNENASAGIMGRLKQEHNFSPKYARFENVPGVGEVGGMGMFQWTWDTGTGYEYPDLEEGRKVYPESRLASYLKWCDENKVNYESTSSQLNYLWDKDLNSQEHVLYTGYNFRPPEMNPMSAAQAATHWTDNYERGQRGNETAYAEEFLEKYKNRAIPDGATQSASGPTNSTSSANSTPVGSSSESSSSSGGIIDTLMNKLLKPMIDMYNALFGGGGADGSSGSSSTSTPGAQTTGGNTTGSGVSAMGGDIASASKWAETQVGTQGFGNNGCTEWVKRYLLQAGSPFGKMMEAGTPTAKDCYDGHEANLMWVPSIMTYAKEHNLYKPGTAPGNRGDIAMINTNGSKEDGPDHVVIAKGDGDYWGNSSSRNRIVSGNIGGEYGADNILGYVATGESGGGTVSTGNATRSQAEIDADAGSSASSTGMGTNIDKTLQDGSDITPQVDEYTITKFNQLSSKYGKAVSTEEQPKVPKVEMPSTEIPKVEIPESPPKPEFGTCNISKDKYGKGSDKEQTIAQAQQQALRDPNEVLNLAQQLKDEHIINSSDMNKIDLKMKPKNAEEAKNVAQSTNDALNLLNENKDSVPEVIMPDFMQEQSRAPKIEMPSAEILKIEVPESLPKPEFGTCNISKDKYGKAASTSITEEQPEIPKIEISKVDVPKVEVPKAEVLESLPKPEFGTCNISKDKYGKAASTEATAPEMWQYLKSKGISDVSIAGIMGNLKAESSLESNILQGGGHSDNVVIDDVTGYGLAQWTSIGRQQKLAEWQSSHGLQGSDWKGQLDFLAGGHDEPVTETLKKMDATNDPYQAALIWHSDYERSADTADMAARRGEYAKEYFASQGGSTGGTSNVATTNNAGTSSSGGTTDTLGGVLGGAFGAIAAMLEKAMGPLIARFKAMYGGLLGGGGNNSTASTSQNNQSQSTTAVSGNDVGNQMLAGAQDFVTRQVPYVWGGADASGADCSGMVKYISDKIGFSDMPRTADIQEEFFRKNSLSYNDKSKAQPGDLVFFKKPDQDYVHHVGVIKSGTNFIHEPCTGRNAEDTGDIDKRDDFYAIGDIRALWEKTHSGSKPTPYGGTVTQTEEDKEENKSEASNSETTLGTGKEMASFKDMDNYMTTQMITHTPEDIDNIANNVDREMRFGKGNLEGYRGISDNLIDEDRDDNAVIDAKIQAQKKWIEEHKSTNIPELTKEEEKTTIIEPKLETSKVFDEDFIEYFKKEISRLDERIDKVEKGLVSTTKKEVQKELDKKDKKIDELQEKVDKKDKQLGKKEKEKKTTLEKIQDTISGVFQSITSGWTNNGKHKIRFSTGDSSPSTTNSEETKNQGKKMSLDERIKYKQWKNLEDAPEIAPNGIHYKENDIQYLMEKEKISREKSIDILKTDDHYKAPTEEEIKAEYTRRNRDIDRGRLNGRLGKEYENEDYRRTADGRIVDKESGQVMNLAEVMSRENGKRFKVIESSGLPVKKSEDESTTNRSSKSGIDLPTLTTFPDKSKRSNSKILPFELPMMMTTTFPENTIDENGKVVLTQSERKNNIIPFELPGSKSPIDFPMMTTTFPENTIDENGKVIIKQQEKNKLDFGNLFGSLGIGLSLGNLGGLFGRTKSGEIDYNGSYTGTKESREPSFRGIFKSKNARNLGLGLLGIGLLGSLFGNKSKKQEDMVTSGRTIFGNQSIEDPTKQIEDKINTIKGLKRDALGNYEAYKGIPDNIITEEDDILVKTKKTEAQEQWLKNDGQWVEPVKEDLKLAANTTKEDEISKKVQGNFKEQEEQAKIRLAQQQEAELKQVEQDKQADEIRQLEEEQKVIQQQRHEAIVKRQEERTSSQQESIVTTDDSKLNEFGVQILSVLQTIADNTTKLLEFFTSGAGTPAQAGIAANTVNNISSMNTMFSGSSQGEYNGGANKMASMIQKLLTK